MSQAAADLQRMSLLLAAAGLGAAHEIVPLAGTGNRTFAVTGRDFDVVLRLPGRETQALVDRAAEAHNAALAAALGVAPAILHRDPGDGAMVMARAPGAMIADQPGSGRAAALGRLGCCLARLHGGPAFRGRMDPWQKIAAYLDAAGMRDGADPAAFGVLWPRIQALRTRTGLKEARLVPCHVDPIPANALDDGLRILLVDWEYAAMSDPLWDLAYVCVEGALEAPEERALLDGYGSDETLLRELSGWKPVVRAVSAAWCMARAAMGDATIWRGEVANRLAALTADLDHAGAAAGGQGAGQ